jgi:hypothetical protein
VRLPWHSKITRYNLTQGATNVHHQHNYSIYLQDQGFFLGVVWKGF